MPRITVKRMPSLHEAQQPIHDDPARFRIARCGRRFGKTKLGVRECMEVGLAGELAWWVAPSYRLATPGWRDLMRLGLQVPGAKVNRGNRSITFPNDGEVWVRTAANPDNLRGDGLKFVVLDEAAYMQEEAWTDALRPSLADKLGAALFISTPAGMVNWLADLWNSHTEHPDWGLHHRSSYDNPFLSHEELDSLRTELGELLFRQEVLAEFVELEGTIMRAHWFRYFRHVPVINSDGSHRLMLRLADGSIVERDDCSVFITCDPALSTKETADYTVFVVWLRTPAGRLLVDDVIRVRMEAPDIVKTAGQLVTQHEAAWIGFESVAYQAALVQFAKKAGIPARPLKADKDKVTRALPLSARLESGDVEFRQDAPWLEDMERELLLFPNSPHDDQVDALAYGVLGGAKQRPDWGAA